MNRNAIYALVVSAALLAGIVTLWQRHKSDPVINPDTPAGPAGVARNEGAGDLKPLEPKTDLVSQLGTPDERERAAARQRRREQFLALLVQTKAIMDPSPSHSQSILPPDNELPPSTLMPTLAETTPVSPTPRAQAPVPNTSSVPTKTRQTQITDLSDRDTPSRPTERRRSSNAEFETVSWHEPTNVEWLTRERRSLTNYEVLSRRISVVTSANGVNIVFPAVVFGSSLYEKAPMRPPLSTTMKLQEIGASALSMRAHVTIAGISSTSRREIPATVTLVADELVRRGVSRSAISIHLLNLRDPVSAADALDRRSVSIALETTDGAFRSQTVHDLTEMLLHSDSKP